MFKTPPSRVRFLVVGRLSADLFICAKHLFGAATVCQNFLRLGMTGQFKPARPSRLAYASKHSNVSRASGSLASWPLT
jgi:hypothetical protein